MVCQGAGPRSFSPLEQLTEVWVSPFFRGPEVCFFFSFFSFCWFWVSVPLCFRCSVVRFPFAGWIPEGPVLLPFFFLHDGVTMNVSRRATSTTAGLFPRPDYIRVAGFFLVLSSGESFFSLGCSILRISTRLFCLELSPPLVSPSLKAGEVLQFAPDGVRSPLLAVTGAKRFSPFPRSVGGVLMVPGILLFGGLNLPYLEPTAFVLFRLVFSSCIRARLVTEACKRLPSRKLLDVSFFFLRGVLPH